MDSAPPDKADKAELLRRIAALEDLVAERTEDRDALWELSTDLLLHAAPDGTIIAANSAWRAILGWDADKVVGSHLLGLVHPDDIELAKSSFASLATGGGLSGLEIRHRHRDGTYRRMSWSARPGEPTYAVGRDVTAERAQALALRDSEDFSRLALSAVGGVGVWHFEVASDLFFCDENVARVYAIDPIAGKTGIPRLEFLANVLPEDMAALNTTMAGGLVNSGDLELEYRIRHPDGSIRWVLSRGHTYFDVSGKPLRRTGVGVDMTKQRLLEEQLRQSQKLEAIGQLTGGIAHDFNNMLTIINTSVEMLRRRLPAPLAPEVERYLAMSTRAVRSAASLTQHLLAFSRKQTLDIRNVDANQLTRDMNDMLGRTLGERVTLRLKLADPAWLARTDPNQLESALLNLAINARDAMQEGGTLSIETTNVNLPIGRTVGDSGEALNPGDYVCVSVSDTGIGMSAEVVRRAFDPFFTTKPIGQGTGLGLSMIYGFVKQSGGDVAIQSSPGAGTTVQVFLPRSRTHPEAASERLQFSPSMRGSGEHVLVVEDEPDVRRIVLDVLAESGYRTSEAADADIALKLLASDLSFDLLLTDVGLPGMDGRELAKQARARRPLLKVLFMTGYAKEAKLRSDVVGKGMDMITKPLSVDELIARVHDMTHQSH